MGSIPDDKHDAAAKAAVGKVLRSSGQKRGDAVRGFIELCVNEIAEGLRDGGGPLAFTPQHGAEIRRYLSYASAERVIGTAKEKRPTDLPKYVRECSAEVAREAKVEQYAKFRALNPEQILAMILRLSRLGSALLLDRLSLKQRNALVELIHRRTGGQHVQLRLGDEHEPEDVRLWTIWYVGRLHTLEPQARKAFTKEGRPSVTCLLIDPSGEFGPQPKNNCGDPINLAGPALVKVFEALTSLPNNQLPAEARSNSKLGRSFGVSRMVIARWRKHPEWEDLQVETKPDGEGGLYYTIDRENHLRAARIVKGEDRGRQKSGYAPEDTP
jgi:hypothetical protein